MLKMFPYFKNIEYKRLTAYRIKWLLSLKSKFDLCLADFKEFKFADGYWDYRHCGCDYPLQLWLSHKRSTYAIIHMTIMLFTWFDKLKFRILTKRVTSKNTLIAQKINFLISNWTFVIVSLNSAKF